MYGPPPFAIAARIPFRAREHGSAHAVQTTAEAAVGAVGKWYGETSVEVARHGCAFSIAWALDVLGAPDAVATAVAVVAAVLGARCASVRARVAARVADAIVIGALDGVVALRSVIAFDAVAPAVTEVAVILVAGRVHGLV